MITNGPGVPRRRFAMLPTVAQVLALDEVRRGQPRVVAGVHRLEEPVRWVHAIEFADAARLLRGGELVLATGIVLPDEGALLDAYVADLAAVGVSALAVELGRRYTGRLPAGFVAAAEQHGLPLIVFDREVPFVEITEAVHARIIDDQLDQLRVSARLHEVFTDLAVAGAGPAEIVRQAALLAGRPVILADLSHHVLACEPAGADPAALLDGFEARSRAVAPAGRSAYDEPSGWLVTTAGARGEDWGRVILVCGQPPGPGDIVLVERTATALALARLLTRQQEGLERQAHATLIGAIVAGAYTDLDEAAARARALGVQVTGRQLLTVVTRFRRDGRGLPAHARAGEVADALADACRRERVPALVGSLSEARVGGLLSVDRAADADEVLAAVCAATRRRLPGGDAVIGVGSAAASLAGARTPPHSRRPPSRAAPTTGWPTCGCVACCTCWATTPGWPRSWTGNLARCWPTTRRRAPGWSRSSPPTWPRAATRRPRRAGHTWPGPPSTPSSRPSSGSSG